MARQTNRDIFRTIEQRILKSQRKYERQGFTVNIPKWFTDLQQRAQTKGQRITKKMLGQAEKLAKTFKKTTISKEQREEEKIYRRIRREEARQEEQYRRNRDSYYDDYYTPPSYYEDDEDDELFHPQYEDDAYYDELPDESSSLLQEVITTLEDMLANGVYSADDLLLAIQTAIDSEGERKVAKGLASVGDDLKDAIEKMGYHSTKQNADGESEWANKAFSLIRQGVNSAISLSESSSNGYGL